MYPAQQDITSPLYHLSGKKDVAAIAPVMTRLAAGVISAEYRGFPDGLVASRSNNARYTDYTKYDFIILALFCSCIAG